MHQRVFVAMPPDAADNRALAAQVARYRADLPRDDIRWIPRKNWHLTVRFIGNTPVASIPELAAAVSRAASGFPPLRVDMDRIGGFPRRRPVVVGCMLLDSDPLAALAESIRVALREAAFGDDPKPFRPHLTVGRFRGRRPRNMPQRSLDGKLAFRRVVVYRSETLPEGAHYTELHSTSLEDE